MEWWSGSNVQPNHNTRYGGTRRIPEQSSSQLNSVSKQWPVKFSKKGHPK